MLDLDQLQLLAQLIDNVGVGLEKLEEAYDENNAEDFTTFKREILNIQKKITDISK